MSLRETLEGLLERTHRPERRAELQAELRCPPCPALTQYLWATFLRLSNRRGSSGFGPLPISWSELRAFMDITGRRFAAWELDMIEALDVLYLNEATKVKHV